MSQASDEKTCPDCGGRISAAAGLGWMDRRGLPLWVGTCMACNVRTGDDASFGVDERGALVPIDAFWLDELT